ncbi:MULTISPECIES: SDR family NAD(P)-dependent oxidoreductase [Streptomyces]|uniref:SDR family NAD(P)-dependent oxidoreductase n=1 Tax=Streptomyces TaxID=1883 RepID=UPI0006B06B35|nr:SDR family oxidoreductase [Streptomyces sp. AS58]KOV69905.1 short-chain dehydrogenase [Streptomyces sp. AS58]
MSKRLQSKVIIVTGGTSGMGSTFARRAASEGATVLIGARDRERGEATAAEITREGGKALFVPTDVTVEEELAHLVDVAVKEFGGLHGAFNNAGGGNSRGALRSMDASHWDSVIALNLTSVFYSLKHEIPAIVASGGGSIVNNASVVGVVGDPSAIAYTAAKHGVLGLTRSAALDAAREGVRVNALVTGLVNTPLWRSHVESSPESAAILLDKQPAGRAADEAEIAAFTAFLISDESPFINGAALAIDGALTAGY